MKLTMLYKDPGSGNGGCRTVYLAENGEIVVQGDVLDDDTFAQLKNVLPGENAVRISLEIILGAVQRYQEQQKRQGQ
jgi:hypothetical protein